MAQFAVSLTGPIFRSFIPHRIVAIIGSAGGLPALLELLSVLPVTFPFPVIIAQHLSADAPSILPTILGHRTALTVKWADPGEVPRGGVAYVARPGYQIAVTLEGFVISALARTACSWLASPDVLLGSVAECYGSGAIGIVLSGMIPVGAYGLRNIQHVGGITMAQSQISALHTEMPAGAVDLGKAEIVLSPARIAGALIVLAEMVEADQLI
jgi:two-component system, chemotaxis family, protein-glutamate methylesterase/glutaminase